MADELSKNDLFILMESYKNNIQLNTTILEQQKQILILNDQFIDKQKDLCNSVEELVDRLGECSKTLSENHNILTNSIQQMSLKITSSLETISNNLKLDTSKMSSSLSNKIYFAMGGMITIIISLISLFMVFSHKFEQIISLIKQ